MPLIGQAFQKVLIAYRDEHSLCEREMAQLAKVSKPTMHSWLTGTQPKTIKRITEICENLGLNPDLVLNPHFKYLGVGLNFKILQDRFQERIKHDPATANEPVILAGAILHARLLSAGFPYTSTTLPTGQVIMHAAQDAHVSKIMVSLQWTESAIMLIVAMPGQQPLLSEPLNEDTFSRAVDILNQ